MRSFETKYSRYTISWFWSDVYWYVTAVDRYKRRLTKCPIGCGETQNDALNDFAKLKGN